MNRDYRHWPALAGLSAAIQEHGMTHQMSRHELEVANEQERRQLRRLVLLAVAYKDASRAYEADRLNWEKVRDLESKERLFFAALDRWERGEAV